jgi:hypothetical protein
MNDSAALVVPATRPNRTRHSNQDALFGVSGKGRADEAEAAMSASECHHYLIDA